ncbi:MAG TPA: tripartite tricarboxylate transporter substrate binding protein [Burkholderiales bacterium]|nr:tripartite tricarboxylate transporter substrate binding protein [Burkholderiales bacterium]
MPLRHVAAICLALVSCAAAAQSASPGAAQAYPTRSIRMLIPFTAGSAADIIARAMEPALREHLGQSLVIDNRGGAGGNIAAEITAKSPADGYTLLMATIGTQAINVSLYTKLNYHPQRDFTTITLVGDSPNAMVVNPIVPVKSVKEFIALAKSRPGVLNYGSSGAGTTVHLSAELFSVMTGTKMVHVPFKGAAESLTALIAGETDLQFASLSSAIPLIKSGRLRALGVTSPQRSPSLPDLPTIAELGLPGYAAVAWFGIVGPAKLPANVVATINKATLASVGQQDVKERLFNSGVEVRTMGPEEFAKYTETEIQKWAKVVKASGARAG